MKALKIHKFYVCQISGEVMIELSFALNEGHNALLKLFSNIENANAHIYRAKVDWILNALELYINHKRHIIGSDQSKIVSLNLCNEALQRYEQMSLKQICAGVIKGQAHFKAILPVLNNNSYQSSANNIAEIISFCETELK